MTLMYNNLIEYNSKYEKTGSLWQYHKDDPNDSMRDSESFKFKSRLTNSSNKAGITNVEIAVALKYLSNFWRTLQMPPIYEADRATICND